MIAAICNWTRKRCGYRFPPLGNFAFRLIIKLLPTQLRAELFPGLSVTLDLGDEVQRATYWQGERFESPTVRILDRWVSEGATRFFDIGSNYGFFTLALISKHPQLTVEAFEPNPETFRHLEEIKAENHLARVRLWQIGLGDSCATLPFSRGTTDSGHSTFGSHPHLSPTDTIDVLDFESWRRRAGLSLPTSSEWLAKIDVEGFEMKVLTGMRAALEQHAFRGLAIELNEFTLGFFGVRADDIYSYLQSLGYVGLARAGERSFARTGNEFFALQSAPRQVATS